MAFNPNEHLRQLPAGKDKKTGQDKTTDYLDVKWRLVWFREQCPDGTIKTEMIHLDMDRMMTAEVKVWNKAANKYDFVQKEAKGFCVFRAVVEDGKGGIGTGTKSEAAVNFGDFIEKGETGAIGRALALLGYGTQFTGDEFDEGERLADSPVERKPQDQQPVASIPTFNGLRNSAVKHLSEATFESVLKDFIRDHKLAPDHDFTPDDIISLQSVIAPMIKEARAQKAS